MTALLGNNRKSQPSVEAQGGVQLGGPHAYGNAIRARFVDEDLQELRGDDLVVELGQDGDVDDV